MKKENKKGISLLEFLLVLSIIVILSTFAVPAWNRFFEINRYNNFIMAVENAINRAKVVAMEKSTNVGVCISDNQILIYDTGYARSTDPCTGTLLFTVTPESENISISSAGTIIFDPRGLNIMVGGNVCIHHNKFNTYYRIIIGRGHQRIERGEGECP
ncbi:MAG: GspH/FimT family pseudopilin, partial [Thermodesulfobacterium sp.]|nr:GspH/FimT family pseudopilin [Thermodesulfobacterium sp.]